MGISEYGGVAGRKTVVGSVSREGGVSANATVEEAVVRMMPPHTTMAEKAIHVYFSRPFLDQEY